MDRLKESARARSITLPQLAVAWTLAHPAADVAIVGAHRPDQRKGTASAAADIRLAPEDLAVVDVILTDAVPMQGPHPEGM